ncbi:putative DNA-directed RNA polymerase I subunit RPA34.5 [Lyophyllum shimeji]|uniref:DNA-directed RNA polymerase I subunit RPA34.5 n=1 Tax=Lyophyllum shimeji TaxID=47721 RepID=A0A9P3ULP4_LYOSH|nr:putative DNA-directed RNA polymerase I subunit RPA34.5 [Lyophyllum shimeji]
MSSSESSSSSSSPEPQLAEVFKKPKDKGKKKSMVPDKGKNEGVDPNWAYKPPAGATLVQNVGDAGEFDWDTIANDDDLELWLIRVPESVKPKYLESMTIQVPPASKTTRTGTLNRKHATFDIWSVGEDDEDGGGGEEIKSLSCLLPRKSKKGKLYPAPKPIARHMVVSAQPVAPSSDPSSTVPIQPHPRPPRECYPPEVLKHKFQPYGSLSGAKEARAAEEGQMDVEVPTTQPEPPSPTQKKIKRSKADSPEVDTKKTKGKKRKGDGGEAPPEKKQKKPKTS